MKRVRPCAFWPDSVEIHELVEILREQAEGLQSQFRTRLVPGLEGIDQRHSPPDLGFGRCPLQRAFQGQSDLRGGIIARVFLEELGEYVRLALAELAVEQRQRLGGLRGGEPHRAAVVQIRPVATLEHRHHQ